MCPRRERCGSSCGQLVFRPIRGVQGRSNITRMFCSASSTVPRDAPGARLGPLRRGDPVQDALSHRRAEVTPMPLGCGVRRQRARKIVGHASFIAGIRGRPGPVRHGEIDRREPGGRHQSLLDQPRHPRLVALRPGAPRLARREDLPEAGRVQRDRLAVDPAETERLFHRLTVRYARLGAVLLADDEPDAGRAGVVLGEPPRQAARVGGASVSKVALTG